MPTFYHAPHSRSTAILTLVHELGDPADLDIVRVGIRRGDGSGAPDPRNPHPEGKVPFIADGDDMIRERAAIIAWLTERYPSDLAPLAGQTGRGPFLSWLAWYAGVMEPVAILDYFGIENDGLKETFRDLPTAIRQVEAALKDRSYLLGDSYTAADLLIAGAFAFFRQMIPGTGPIEAWVDRCQDRYSVRRAAAEDAEWMERMSPPAA